MKLGTPFDFMFSWLEEIYTLKIYIQVYVIIQHLPEESVFDVKGNRRSP